MSDTAVMTCSEGCHQGLCVIAVAGRPVPGPDARGSIRRAQAGHHAAVRGPACSGHHGRPPPTACGRRRSGDPVIVTADLRTENVAQISLSNSLVGDAGPVSP